MKKTLILITILIFAQGCSSTKSNNLLDNAMKSYQVFEQDYLNFSKISLQREWILRTAIRDEALRVESENKNFSAEEAKTLAKKYAEAYKKDVEYIERARTEHLKALINSKIGEDLISAVRNYSSSGKTDFNKFLLEQFLPTITEIINQKGK